MVAENRSKFTERRWAKWFKFQVFRSHTAVDTSGIPVFCVLSYCMFGPQLVGVNQPHTTKPTGVTLLRSHQGTKRREGRRDHEGRENTLVHVALAWSKSSSCGGHYLYSLRFPCNFRNLHGFLTQAWMGSCSLQNNSWLWHLILPGGTGLQRGGNETHISACLRKCSPFDHWEVSYICFQISLSHSKLLSLTASLKMVSFRATPPSLCSPTG